MGAMPWNDTLLQLADDAVGCDLIDVAGSCYSELYNGNFERFIRRAET